MDSKQQSRLPTALEWSTEANSWLVQFKKARATRWSLRSSRSLYDLSDLSAALLALGRDTEAIEIGYFVEPIAFSGDYEIWTPATLVFFLATFAADRLGTPATVEQMRQKCLQYPGYILREASIGERTERRLRDLDRCTGRKGADVRVTLFGIIRHFVVLYFAATREGERYPWLHTDEIRAPLLLALSELEHHVA